MFYPPKTKSGLRTIPMPVELVHELKRWKLACPRSEHDLVFCYPDGKPLHRSTVLRQILRPACRRAGLREVDMKSLRHSFASALIAGGASVTEVQGLMGHSDPTVTLRVYSHFLKGVETDSIDRLAAAVTSERRSTAA